MCPNFVLRVCQKVAACYIKNSIAPNFLGEGTMATKRLAVMDALHPIVVQIPQGITEEKLTRMARVLGRNDYLGPETSMVAKGFHFTVSRTKLLAAFQYAAALSWGRQDPQQLVDYGAGSDVAIVYRGDIPDFALDRIEEAQQVGIEMFTMHSNEPLPVITVLAKVDPVVIGWTDCPFIHLDPKTNRVDDYDKIESTGFVIAMWDIDKELQLLEK